MSLSDRRRRLIGRLRRRKSRAREGLFLAEGIRCATEVVGSAVPIRFAVMSPRAEALEGGPALVRLLAARGIERIPVADPELAALAGTDSPQGVVLVAAQPDPSPQALAGGNVLVADGIADPGNLGALIRSAVAFGVRALIALDGCVDPYNPKAVRASAGLVSRLAIVTTSWPAARARLREQGHRLLVTDAEGRAAPIDEAATAEPWALVVGNEGSGARPEVRADADATLAIPLRGGVDSLNAAVAGSILMYALTTSRPTPRVNDQPSG